MFRTTIASFVFAASAIFALPASAQDALPHDRVFFDYSRFYVEGRGGGSFSAETTIELFGRSDDYVDEDGFAIAAAAGIYIMPLVRLEYEFWYFEAEGGRLPQLVGPNSFSGETRVFGNLVNVIHEFDVDPSFTPFVGAGLGFAVFDVDQSLFGVTFDKTDTTFAAAVHAGIDVAVTDVIDFTSRYSMIYTGGTDYQDTNGNFTLKKDPNFTHMLTAGIRVNLGTLLQGQ